MDLFSEILTTKHTELTPQTHMRMADLATAIVKENWNKDMPGYVKVEYILGETGQKMSDWMRVLHGYAGNGYGAYVLPEVGSEVLVGFIMGDKTNGVVLGCLYNSQNKLPSNTADKENSQKSLKTKGGHTIVLDETKDKEKIIITTPGKHKFMLDDEKQQISIQKDGGSDMLTINTKDNSISLKAGKKMTIACGSAKIVLDGNSNKIEISGSQLKLSAQQSLEVAGQSLKIEGSMTELKAKGTMKIESSGITQVKGSMLKLN